MWELQTSLASRLLGRGRGQYQDYLMFLGCYGIYVTAAPPPKAFIQVLKIQDLACCK